MLLQAANSRTDDEAELWARIDGELNARSMTLACGMGDLEIAWEPHNDAAVRLVIERKMAQGVRFFILAPMPLTFGLLQVNRRITRLDEIRHNSVRIKDEDIRGLFSSGEATLLRQGVEERTVAVARNAEQVVRNRSIGVPAFQGG